MKRIATTDFLKLSHLPRTVRMILAAGLPRLVQHMIQGQFAIISSHSTPLNTQYQTQGKGRIHPENRGRMNQLKDILKEKGIGFIQMQGAWVNEELAQFIEEDSLFIPNVSEETARKIAEVFDQDAYIYGEGGRYWLKDTKTGNVFQEGSTKQHFRSFFDDEPDFGYSKVKGRRWILDSNQPERAQDLDVTEDTMSTPSHTVAHRPAGSKTTHNFIREGSHQKPAWAFQCYPQQVKWATNEGVIKTYSTDAPAGHLLAVYLPLEEV